MPEISVIVINWNGRRFLQTCLSALRRQTFRDFETIFVDNGSEDGSADFVYANFPEVRMIRLPDNRGFTGANIAAWEQSRGELIALLNNDTEADSLWLQEIHEGNQQFPTAGSFACKMLLFDERDVIDNCGFSLSPAGVTVDLGRGEKNGPDWATPRKVFGASGGAAVYRRSMLNDVGFLDDDFFMTYEDVDLGFRSQLHGYACVFLPNAVVYHRYRATMAKYPARQTFYSQRNIEFVYWKNLPFSMMMESLPQRLLYEIGGAAYFFKQGVGYSFVKAKLNALRHFPAMLRKRREITARRKIGVDQLRVLMRHNWIGARWKKLLSAWRRPIVVEPAIHSSPDTNKMFPSARI